METSENKRHGRSEYMALHPARWISRVHVNGRRDMFNHFMKVMQPGKHTRILDLGVTSDDFTPGSNFFEKLYPHKSQITCAGVEDASHLEEEYPGIQFVQIEPGKHLPFDDHEFDIIFNAAVVEHAGTRQDQRFYIEETLRVARYFYLTTPNRWFPVEVHTNLPLVHYLPPKVYRRVFHLLGFKFYASEENLNLLDARELKSLFPDGTQLNLTGYRLLGLVSNLIAYGTSPA